MHIEGGMKMKKISLFMLAMFFVLLTNGFVNASTVVVLDDFDNSTLDSAWSITFDHSSGWSYTESGTSLTVTNVIYSGYDNRQAILSQNFTPLSDFEVNFNFAWVGGYDVMQNVWIRLYDAGDIEIAMAGAYDGRGGNNTDFAGAFLTASVGSNFFHASSGIATGSAVMNIIRVGSTIEIYLDSGTSPIVSGNNDSLISRVDFGFAGRKAGTAAMPFGTESVDLVRVAGTTSAVPLPGSVWLLVSGLLGLAAVRRQEKN